MSTSAIGIFDSGIGGLTVANAISKHLPNEPIVYFGDTAHLPYGEKSVDAIIDYSLKIGRFLIEADCKMLLIACNSVSSVAYKPLVNKYGKKIPIVNVIDPAVKRIAELNLKKIGIIGTQRTIASNMYTKKINALQPNTQVFSLATPLLAPMIEAGYFQNKISHEIIRDYLQNDAFRDIDALVLACTHYPLIKKEIEQLYAKKFQVFDSTDFIVKDVEKKLQDLNIQGKNNIKPSQHRFYVSDYTESFTKTATLFYGKNIQLRQYQIWK